jgi:hypothetical protein
MARMMTALAAPLAPPRWRPAAWGCACALLLASMSGLLPDRRSQAADRPTLYVCLPTEVKSTVMARALQIKLPALEVTVFGRYRDFEESLASKRPDAVLALQILLIAKNAPATLRGVEAGSDVESFVLISAGKPLAGSLANLTVGVVDFLGRKDTQDLVVKLLGTPSVHTKLVTKVEDLLSLLEFSAADAILIRSGMVKALTGRSRLMFYVRELPGSSIGRAAVAVLSPSARALVTKQFQGLDPATNRMIGVDGWRPSP